MWTSQVYGHHDKMAGTKTHRTSQTRSIQRRNIHKEITIFLCFSDFSVFLLLILKQNTNIIFSYSPDTTRDGLVITSGPPVLSINIKTKQIVFELQVKKNPMM